MRGFLKQKNNIWVILAYFGGVCPPLGPPEGVGGSTSPNTQSLWVAWSYQQIKSIGKIISLVKMVEDTCRGLLKSKDAWGWTCQNSSNCFLYILILHISYLGGSSTPWPSRVAMQSHNEMDRALSFPVLIFIDSPKVNTTLKMEIKVKKIKSDWDTYY